MDLSAIPDWLGTAVLGGLAAAVGFFAKAHIERKKEIHTKRTASLERLKRLAALLQQSESIYMDQNNLVCRLWNELSGRLGSTFKTGLGYDEDFYVAYDQLTSAERELHSIIRGTTMNSLRTVNEQLTQWLSEDLEFKVYAGPDPRVSELKEMLQMLERHLALWHDKYRCVLIVESKRSLVYLGDEKKHGKPFPHGIEKVVQDVIDKFSA